MSASMVLPHVRHIGKIALDNVKVYYRSLPVMLEADNQCHLCHQSDFPTLWVDLERPDASHEHADKGWQIHLGVSALTFHEEETRQSRVKPHIDIYISLSEFLRLAKLFEKIKREYLHVRS